MIPLQMKGALFYWGVTKDVFIDDEINMKAIEQYSVGGDEELTKKIYLLI